MVNASIYYYEFSSGHNSFVRYCAHCYLRNGWLNFNSLGKLLCSGNKPIAPLLWLPHHYQEEGLRVLELSMPWVKSLLLVHDPHDSLHCYHFFSLRSLGLMPLYCLYQFMSATVRILGYPSFPRLIPYGSVILFLTSSPTPSLNS